MGELDLGYMNAQQQRCERINLETQLRKERLDNQELLVEIIKLKRRIKELESKLEAK